MKVLFNLCIIGFLTASAVVLPTHTAVAQENSQGGRSFFDWLLGRNKPDKPKSGKDTLNIEEFDGYKNLNQEQLDFELLSQVRKGKDMDAIVYLLILKANINARDQQGRTPLIEASRIGHYDIVKYLIDNGASVNAKDNYDATALQYATQEGNREIVNLLQSNGATKVFN